MTTNFFLLELAKRLKIKNFRGVFMRDELSNMTPHKQESGILNFDPSDKGGSHWVAYYICDKREKRLYYFDSYGTAVPIELRVYLNTDTSEGKIFRSDFMIQGLSSDICGELCMAFIYLMDKTDKSYEDIINSFRVRGAMN